MVPLKESFKGTRIDALYNLYKNPHGTLKGILKDTLGVGFRVYRV